VPNFDNIKKCDNDIKAFLSVFEEEALEEAENIDRNREKTGALLGVPIAIKDNISVKGYELTAGSKILKGYIAPYDATAIEN